MEAVSTNNQTLPVSGEETVKFVAYSSAVHKVIVMVNAGVIGLLQLINQQTSVLETHKAPFMSVDMRVRPGMIPQRLVGHTSHLFGGLAALLLIYVVCSTFALVLLFLWLLWLSAIAYTVVNEFMIYSKANKSGTGSPRSLPV
ncbi:hypothetical protein N665_0336s0014 [Sinapis alba]|nr:hypothetical protein N665_0336s0014 [Sinapis alba]